MKLLFLSSIVILFNSCAETPQDFLIGRQFSDHKKVTSLKDFEKLSDTTFYINQEIGKEYSLLNLKNANKDLIVYSLINSVPNEKRFYTILDTLMINSKNSEKVTIGYCDFDLKSQNAGNIIALVETTENKKIFNRSIKAAWSANPQTEKIEVLNNLEELQCLNAWYDGANEIINYDELEE